MISFQALAGAVAAYGSMLASMTPEARAAYFAEQARRRELERLEASPEVVLARECVANEGLTGHAEDALLDFARELARRRLEPNP